MKKITVEAANEMVGKFIDENHLLRKRIEELENAQPAHVDLIKINGLAQEIVGDYREEIGYIKNGWNKVHGKWIKMNPVPLIEVVERAK